MEEHPEMEREMPPAPPDRPVGGEDVAVGREFLEAVRRAAGFRVSPRQLEAALEALASAGEEATPERAAELVVAARGERSRRQRRHADLWRVLGAQLAVRGAPGVPEAQREFIARARAVAGRPDLTDELVLRVAVEIAGMEAPLEPRLVGEVVRWLMRHRRGALAEEEIAGVVAEAIAAVATLPPEPERGSRRGSAKRGGGRSGRGAKPPRRIKRRKSG